MERETSSHSERNPEHTWERYMELLDEYRRLQEQLEAERATARAVERNLGERLGALQTAVHEYLAPAGAQWYIDCNERTKGKNYPSKAKLSRAVLYPANSQETS